MTLYSSEPNTSKLCGYCGKIQNIVLDGDDYVCDNCGAVKEKKIDWIYEKSKSNFNTEIEDKLYQSSEVKRSFSNKKDYTGNYVGRSLASKLQKTYRKTKIPEPLDRSKYKGLMELQRIFMLLYIPKHIQAEIITHFLDFNSKKYFRGRNMYSCTVALTVMICNLHNISISVCEVLKATGITRKKFNKEYFYLYYLFENPVKTSADPNTHFSRFLSYVDSKWSKYNLFKSTLTEVLDQINFNKEYHGRDAIVCSVTLIFYLLKNFKYPYQDKYLSKITVNKLTLKNYWQHILDKYPFIREKYSKTKAKSDIL